MTASETINVEQITAWLKEDKLRFDALKMAASLGLNQSCLGAGFVRNLVWDKLHHKAQATPLNDIDFIYYDKEQCSQDIDLQYQRQLAGLSSLPWSVKNQARMHLRNGNAAYTSVASAMSYWPEIETAVAARLEASGEITLIAPFGVTALFNSSITLNPKHHQPAVFMQRVRAKKWLEHWPNLRVSGHSNEPSKDCIKAFNKGAAM